MNGRDFNHVHEWIFPLILVKFAASYIKINNITKADTRR